MGCFGANGFDCCHAPNGFCECAGPPPAPARYSNQEVVRKTVYRCIVKGHLTALASEHHSVQGNRLAGACASTTSSWSSAVGHHGYGKPGIARSATSENTATNIRPSTEAVAASVCRHWMAVRCESWRFPRAIPAVTGLDELRRPPKPSK